VEGTEITIESPTFLKAASNFLGYIEDKYWTSIMIHEVPKSITEVMLGLTKEEFVSRGVTLLSTDNVYLGDDEAKLLKLKQIAHGLEFTKWLVVFGNKTNSVMVTASFQTALTEDVSEKLKNTILTVRWDRSTNTDFLNGLSFRIGETKSLKIAARVEDGLVLTSDGNPRITQNKTPYSFVVTVKPKHYETFNIHDYIENTRKLLIQTERFSQFKILNHKQTKIKNLNVVTIQANAFDTMYETWRFIHYSLLFNNDKYYVIQSVADSKEREIIEKEFDLLLASFELLSKT
jgi:hypothetical protein